MLLVVLIFLMLTTTYSRFTELQVKLPVADAEQAARTAARDRRRGQRRGRYSVNRKPVDGRSVEVLTAALRGRRRRRRGSVGDRLAPMPPRRTRR